MWVMGLPRRSRSTRGLYPETKQCPPDAIDVSSTPIASKSNNTPLEFGDDSPIINDSPSPIPFMSTQDGTQDNDVVWNYYSPKARRKQTKKLGTPVAKRKENIPLLDFSPISSMPVKKKLTRHMQKSYLNNLKEELTALNKKVQTLICPKHESNNSQLIDCAPSTSMSADDSPPNDFITDSYSSNTQFQPLKNRISEKIIKCESEGIESDDSMNEFLLRASQMVEEEIYEKNEINKNTSKNISKKILDMRKAESPSLINDSFDTLIGNINDSYIEILSQVPAKKQLITKINNVENNNCKNELPKENIDTYDEQWTNISNISALLNGSILNDSKSSFIRHKSMPITPNSKEKTIHNKSSSSFSRHNSMPYSQRNDLCSNVNGTQAGSCTIEEIKRKRELARQKLLAKKQDSQPIKSYSKSVAPPVSSRMDNEVAAKKSIALIKENNPLINSNGLNSSKKYTNERMVILSHSNENEKNQCNTKFLNNNSIKEFNIQNEIERKRREAMQRLQRKRSQNNILKK